MAKTSQAVKLQQKIKLKSVDKKITDNSTDLTKKGLNFQADSGELIHKDLGQTLDVVGGITENLNCLTTTSVWYPKTVS